MKKRRQVRQEATGDSRIKGLGDAIWRGMVGVLGFERLRCWSRKYRGNRERFSGDISTLDLA